jgi:hypothetical protein
MLIVLCLPLLINDGSGSSARSEEASAGFSGSLGSYPSEHPRERHDSLAVQFTSHEGGPDGAASAVRHHLINSQVEWSIIDHAGTLVAAYSQVLQILLH